MFIYLKFENQVSKVSLGLQLISSRWDKNKLTRKFKEHRKLGRNLLSQLINQTEERTFMRTKKKFQKTKFDDKLN